MSSKPRVFISYRRKPPAHLKAVTALAKKLNKDGGVVAIIDEDAGDPDEGWINWMRNQVREADKVLLVFNEPYQRCYEGLDKDIKEGKGSTFEAIAIVGTFYNKGAHNDKFRAIILKETDRDFVSIDLQRHTIYEPNKPVGYEQLVTWLHKGRPAAKEVAKKTSRKITKFPPCPDLYQDHRAQLVKDCQAIPVFGRVRPDIPMEKNFINLTLEATFADVTDAHGRPLVIPSARKWKGADRGERDETERQTAEKRILNASDLWSAFAKGVILGLPGAGKTTILRHFAQVASRSPFKASLMILKPQPSFGFTNFVTNTS